MKKSCTQPGNGAGKSFGRRTFLKGALAAAPLLVAGPTLLLPRKTAAARNFGPSTATEAYMVPNMPGVDVRAILTVGDSVGNYRMVGIPDGLGAFSHGNQFTLLMNHELGGSAGAVRGHGSRGAFVSSWTIDRKSLKVLKGQDLATSATNVHTWDPATNAYLQGTTVWQRFCSGDLAKTSAYFAKGKRTQERIYLNGEESTTVVSGLVVDQGRPFAWVATGSHAGEVWQLPRLGRMAYENSVASPFAQEKTIVALLDDSALSTAGVISNSVPSEVYFYIGNKEKNGHPIVQAGLTNGDFYGVKISVNGTPVTEESNDFGFGTAATGFIGSGRFALHKLGDVSDLTAVQIEEASIEAGISRLQRVEDGAWDPREGRANDFYFVTTASLTSNCRLWRLRFDNIEKPENGGTIEILLRGDEGHGMLDNVTIDRLGRILMDEDPGNSGRVAKIWLYSIDSGELIEVAHHNPKFFDPTVLDTSAFITQDEESSGLIDAEDILGKGWFLFDVQVHKALADAELVEGGQLLALYVDTSIGA
ncbi:MAG TPA: phytase [Candidatus Binatia bacterium]|nr:phytase [Candidatus Binatia bacterium]